MKLIVVSNYPLTSGHKGTIDRDTPGLFFDFRGKAEGCLKASQTLPPSLEIFDGTSNRTVQIEEQSSFEHILLSSVLSDLPHNYKQALFSVHSDSYVEGLKRICSELPVGEVNHNFGHEADVWCGTYQAALSSIFGSLQCIDLVLDSDPRQLRTFANVWPPGHHAEGVGSDGTSDLALGFCYFSNAAVAAWYAKNLGLRTLVIDIDNHSGNGTRKAVMNQKDLAAIDFVYVSPFDESRGSYLDGYWNPEINQVDGYAREYPYRHSDERSGTKKHPVYTAPNILSLEFLGKEYRGKNSLLEPAATHNEIIARYTCECIPWILDYKPDLVIWSVGLDAAADDELGALGFLTATMYDVIKLTSDALPSARMTGIMEGGYKPENWSRYLWPALHGFLNSKVIR